MEKLAMIFGVVLVAVGVLGFVPGITSDGMLLGIFEVDGTHNVIHILTGLIALAAARGMGLSARRYFQVFGIVYALVTILGFLQAGTVLGLFAVNGADNVLHLLIAALALWAGFGMRSGSMPASSPAM